MLTDARLNGFSVFGIGVCTPHVPLDEGMPGWSIKSWGYHGDDGKLYSYPRKSDEYGPKYGAGDVVGCGFDQASGMIFFTKNGERLGKDLCE